MKSINHSQHPITGIPSARDFRPGNCIPEERNDWKRSMTLPASGLRCNDPATNHNVRSDHGVRVNRFGPMPVSRECFVMKRPSRRLLICAHL